MPHVGPVLKGRTPHGQPRDRHQPQTVSCCTMAPTLCTSDRDHATSEAEYHRCMTERRFSAPWSVEEQPACFVVPDHGIKSA